MKTPTMVAGLAAALATVPVLAANETHSYGISLFGFPGTCGYPEQTHAVHRETASSFSWIFELLKATGQWQTVIQPATWDIGVNQFTDVKKSLTCDCNGPADTTGTGADAADVLYVHTHGSHSLADNRSSLDMGSSTDEACAATTDNHILFGNAGGDLEIAVVKACQMGDYEVWKKGGYKKLVTPASSFSVWNSFHGDSSCGSHVTEYVGDYAALSVYDGVGENWLDAAYDFGWFDDDDDCPVSIVFGDSKAKRQAAYEQGGWLDRKQTGSKTGSTIFFMTNCDPDHGMTLPD